VNLFSALIRHDVFSHDAYLCTLVARGDLSAVPPATSTAIVPPSSVQPIPSVATPGPSSQAGPTTPASVSSITPSTTPRHDAMDDRGPLFPPLPRMTDIPRQPDFVDDPNIDDDLDRLLQHITQEQQNMDQVGFKYEYRLFRFSANIISCRLTLLETTLVRVRVVDSDL